MQLKIDFNLTCSMCLISNLEEIKKIIIEKLYAYYEYDYFPIQELIELNMIDILEIIDNEIFG